MENDDEDDSECLQDSLDINEVPDSGIGSSSERTYKVNTSQFSAVAVLIILIICYNNYI
mgnify:FL=1